MTGKGSTIALFELHPFNTADVTGFRKCYDAASAPTVVKVGGGTAGQPTREVALDIDVALGLAPDAHVLVYEASDSNYAKSAVDGYTKIIDDNQAQVLSTSYGGCEAAVSSLDSGLMAAENTLFEQAATEGMSVFAATGDTGSEACYASGEGVKSLSVQDPARPAIRDVRRRHRPDLGQFPLRADGMERIRGRGRGTASPASGRCRGGSRALA